MRLRRYVRDPEAVAYAVFLGLVAPVLFVGLHGQPEANYAVLVSRNQTLLDLRTAVAIITIGAIALRSGPLGFFGAILEFAGISSYLIGNTGVPYLVIGFLLVFVGGLTWNREWRGLLFPRKPDPEAALTDDEDDDEDDDDTTHPA